MKGTLLAVAFVATGFASPASAQKLFDGTWKIDAAAAQMPTKPFGSTLADGVLECITCNVPYKVIADGAFHAVPGQAYWDETSVTVVDAMTVKQAWRKNGKLTDETTSTVAADGKTLKWDDVDTSAPNGAVLKSSGTNIRVSNGASGSHTFSGTWRPGKLDSISDDAQIVTVKSVGKSVTMTTPVGYQYTAVVGGPAVAIIGDLANTKAALSMPDPKTLVETDSRAGKTVSTLTLAVQPGGKMVKATFVDTLRGTTTRSVAIKQ